MAHRNQYYTWVWVFLFLLFLGMSWKIGLFDSAVPYPRCSVLSTRLSVSLADRSVTTILEDALLQQLLLTPLEHGVVTQDSFDVQGSRYSIVLKPASQVLRQFRINANWNMIYDLERDQFMRVSLQPLKEYLLQRHDLTPDHPTISTVNP
ncbi:MAG TPA: hypothetical protein PLX97_06090 [Gemmatales bacterium]|nr:hypothetical protein [Gemmatales bacterium]